MTDKETSDNGQVTFSERRWKNKHGEGTYSYVTFDVDYLRSLGLDPTNHRSLQRYVNEALTWYMTLHADEVERLVAADREKTDVSS